MIDVSPYRFIKANPARQGAAEAVVTEFLIPVWAVIGHLQALDWDVMRTANDYEIPEEAVKELIPYYLHNQDAVEARLQANMPPSEAPVDKPLGAEH